MPTHTQRHLNLSQRPRSGSPRPQRQPQPTQRTVGWLLVLALCLATAVAVRAQQPPAPEAPPNELHREAPQAAMRGFLEACRAGDYQRAAEYLDLHALSPATRAKQGAILARELKTVLDRTLWVDLDELSDAPEGAGDDGLPASRDLVGTIETRKGAVPILLDRVTAEDGTPIWKIASPTVRAIPALHAEFGYGALGAYLPHVFFEIRFLEIQLWQWLGLLLLIVVAAAVSWFVTTVVVHAVRPIIARSRISWGDDLLPLAAGPLRLSIAVLLFSGAVYPLGLAVPVQAFLNAVAKALFIIAATWLLVRLVRVIAQTVEQRLVARGQAMAMSVVPLGRRTVQVLVISLAALAVLQNLGINVTGILAGLGIGGLAVALAAQKTVENLFGGITLIADQPVRVGDFCRFGGRLGTVEEVGLRSTRVRTLDRTLVTVANAEFSALQLENFTQRDRIWFHTTIGLRYETTPDQLRYVLVELKQLLVAHPRVDPDPARVRFVGFGACSLDLEIFAYIRTSDYNEYLAIQEDLLLQIMERIAASGTGFAFPSQTIYATQDAGLDAQKSRAAETQLREWRAAGRLGQPSDQAALV